MVEFEQESDIKTFFPGNDEGVEMLHTGYHDSVGNRKALRLHVYVCLFDSGFVPPIFWVDHEHSME